MWIKGLWVLLVIAWLLNGLAAPVWAKKADAFVFGLLLAGPADDDSWNQAHHDGGRIVEKRVPGSRMIFIDNVNPSAQPEVDISMHVDELVSDDARLVIATAAYMNVEILRAARRYPGVHFVLIGGDDVITGKAPQNLSNLMGRMTVGQMMAGFAAALTTRTGKIGYLGAQNTEQGRRQAAACYQGARYGWEKVLKKKPAALTFTVTWTGHWYNVPGEVLAPQQATRQLFEAGCDVVVSGIRTVEVLQVADQMRSEDLQLWAIAYDDVGTCDKANAVCLGAPHFNWGPGYIRLVTASRSGTWRSEWLWLEPDWIDMNDAQTSPIGFFAGPALTEDAWMQLDAFAQDLGAGRVNLFKGPLAYRDGSAFLRPGERASDKKLWYIKQVLQGMQVLDGGR